MTGAAYRNSTVPTTQVYGLGYTPRWNPDSETRAAKDKARSLAADRVASGNAPSKEVNISLVLGSGARRKLGTPELLALLAWSKTCGVRRRPLGVQGPTRPACSPRRVLRLVTQFCPEREVDA